MTVAGREGKEARIWREAEIDKISERAWARGWEMME